MGSQKETNRGDGRRADLSDWRFAPVEFKPGDFTIFDDESVGPPIEAAMRSFMTHEAIREYQDEMLRRMWALRESGNESAE